MEKGYLDENNKLKKEWGSKYIDIIALIVNAKSTVPVFTPNCKFISQDTRHLTPSGAEYIGVLTESKLREILKL